MPDTLDFEDPIGILLKEIEAMRLMPQTADRRAAIARLEARANDLRADIYARLTPWQVVQVGASLSPRAAARPWRLRACWVASVSWHIPQSTGASSSACGSSAPASRWHEAQSSEP